MKHVATIAGVLALVLAAPAALATATAREGAATSGDGDVPAARTLTPVDDKRLLAGTEDTSGWTMYGGNFQNWRYSPLADIDTKNVGKLAPKWIFQTGVPGQLEAAPIVADGVLYLTAPHNHVFAVDAVTGEMIWQYAHQMPSDIRICCGPTNRGVAIAGDRVFMATLDAHLVALDRATGAVLWDVAMDDHTAGYSATAAPLVVKNLVLSGIAGGEYGARGFVDAYDIKTGKRVWRRYTVPGAGEPGVETWEGESWKTGGGPTWVTGSYDPELDLIFWPTGNPSPDWNGDSREGDNLYTNSVLALAPADGALKWYFQFTPHDVWDYDATNGLVVADVDLGEGPRRAVLQPNRNGYLYVLDAKSGKFLKASQYVDRLNWSRGLDANGRPQVDERFLPQEGGNPEFICPGNVGGNNGSFTYAYSGRTGLLYVPSIESCGKMEKETTLFVNGQPFWGGGPGVTEGETGQAYGKFVALDPVSGKTRWSYKDRHPLVGGALATAGGVIFTGNQRGYALAFDDTTGALLWKFQMGSMMRGQPITYKIDGRQYVAVPSGGGGIAVAIIGEAPNVTLGSALTVFALPQ